MDELGGQRLGGQLFRLAPRRFDAVLDTVRVPDVVFDDVELIAQNVARQYRAVRAAIDRM
ncbi:hypothetical protein [Dactylosporangium sp. NPDC051541]|uniref:hypothetical protein n=1 Tax=Dactylosporangium sp. NPDC051541 TaxID=3363977 RepID=UPI0037B84320